MPFFRRKKWFRLSLKYVISGTSATFAHMLAIFIFYDLFYWSIFISTSLAFALAFSLSFSLQKFWTFRNYQKKYLSQISAYFVLNLGNFFINGFLMVFLVDSLNIYYLLAQALVSFIVGLNSFFIYKFYIFKVK